jgi:hypothetical protein
VISDLIEQNSTLIAEHIEVDELKLGNGMKSTENDDMTSSILQKKTDQRKDENVQLTEFLQ